MAETEKITINMNVVDLGQVDLLVEQGFYSNRTDFIKTAIRNQITSHAKVIEKVMIDKAYLIGITHFDRKSLEQVAKSNKVLDIKVVGMLVLKEDIDVELAKKTIKAIKVFGVFKASSELKKAFNQ